MKKNDYKKTDLYYIILKECVENPMIAKHQICEKHGLNEHSPVFYDLEKFNLIEIKTKAANQIELKTEGFNAFLSIGSQRQSERQARKATYFAVWALGISIVSFIASIVFNILAL